MMILLAMLQQKQVKNVQTTAFVEMQYTILKRFVMITQIQTVVEQASFAIHVQLAQPVAMLHLILEKFVMLQQM